MSGVTLDVTFEFIFPSPHGTFFPSSYATLLNCWLCYNTRCRTLLTNFFAHCPTSMSNDYNSPLYTLMVCDEWQNGI